MEFNKENIEKALSYVIEPDLKKDIVSLGLVSGIEIQGKTVQFAVKVSNPAMHNKKRMEEACIHHVQRFFGDVEVKPLIEQLPPAAQRTPEQRSILPGVKHIIAIASGKGGVGKSTITANLAAGLAKAGFKVGLIDADIYGPSMPMMFDVIHEKPGMVEINGITMMKPVENYGVKILSIGFFADANQAIVWRGPMASKALNQMFRDVYWGELDYMLIDLPPGTGDIHLSIVQIAPLSGAVIVSTPQAVALADARKGVGMFRLPSINIPVLGIVENMSYFTPEELPENKYYIFGKNGAKNLAEELKVPLLAQIPIVQSIREAGDVGRPAVMQENTLQSNAFMQMTESIIAVTEKKITKMNA
jgi:ATP-binding protein involved in chromosome partitioning